LKKRKIFFYSILILALSTFGYIKYYNMNINDIGLKVLSWVKKVKGNAVDLNQFEQSNTPKMKHDNWSILLKKYVTEIGQVNYKGFIQDSVLFQSFLDDLSQHPPGNNWNEKEKIAYWINAYNAFTVKLIIDHYPLKSIKEIGDGLPMVNSPWDIKFFKIGNIDFDLNTIEHEILRKEFKEPRIHFAINCASFSCPKLRNEAFMAEVLETQLNDQTQQFINNPDKNIISKNKLELSKIFDWFKSDFTKEKSLLQFLKPYLKIDVSNNPSIEHLVYDWRLNE